MTSGESTTFTCPVCKKMKGWITAGRFTSPCTNCGSRFYGEEKVRKSITHIEPVEVNYALKDAVVALIEERKEGEQLLRECDEKLSYIYLNHPAFHSENLRLFLAKLKKYLEKIDDQA